MFRPVFVFFSFLIALGMAACADPLAKVGNTPDEQRSHSQKAHKELSSEVRK
jgi:hypothetical protein